jgi:hypothetical protein
MPKQPAIPGLRDAMKKVTRREQFLAEMEALGMRTSLSENRESATLAGLKRQSSPYERRLPPNKAIKPQSRRSQMR